MNDSLSIYFAGDLFNHKDLIGNLLLSSAIEKNSSGRFKCIVPQHLEQSTSRSVEIRNNDLLEVVKSDLILLNFDRTEIDYVLSLKQKTDPKGRRYMTVAVW